MAAPNSSSRRSRASVLHENDERSVVLLDIPASLEESQVLAGHAPSRRIYSTQPVSVPFVTPEPKDASVAPLSQPAAVQLRDLMTAATVQDALQYLKTDFAAPFCLPRLELPAGSSVVSGPPIVPEKSEYLHGSVQHLTRIFATTAPMFDLVVLDPPWPNRSARRRADGYPTTGTLREMRRLLSQVPVPSHLNPGGLVAVWITNKPSIVELLTSPTGLFASWGIELVVEWTWIKVTSEGDPIFDIHSQWRKPWERLLVAKRTGDPTPVALKSKTIVAVPDVHSRKPNLRGLFQDILGNEYLGLEVFARNLTAGWWSWGDDVLHFQEAHHWVPPV